MAIGIKAAGRGFAGQSIWTVIIILSSFIFYRRTLYFKFLLGDRIQQKAHPVGFEPEHFFQLVAGYGFIIIGAVAVGTSIECTSGIRNNFKMLFVGYVITALEHHVLKKVRKTGFPDFLPGGTNMVSNIDMYHRVTVILMDNQGQSVG